MGRVIEGAVSGDFHPLVGLRTKGNFVKGTVLATGKTMANNPTVTLALLDLDGTTSRSVSKGVYEEIDVNVGDTVQVVGSVKQLREKLPQLAIGDVVTITFKGKEKISGGKTLSNFLVEVE